ncbi:integral membrane sensor signal transduction histidine kinase [Streptomyces noursei ATCC 11455]|uniref:nitrate- and nitrite sensing domain-containing protein n=1 Tax=Streptomyces noursei TaxID=1971 RepID=UPI00081CF92A|nr:integral membrane sensor signal transduction histidine kinase [Streptomyces noursei ATCC 11455]
MGAVAVVAVAVLGAGAPAVLTAADNAGGSQHLVDLAGLNAHAVTLAHTLADERDAMTAYVAAGRTGRNVTQAPTDSQRAQVDRQIDELRGQAQGVAGDTAAFAAADKLLKQLPETRQKALAGPATAEQVYDEYSAAVAALGTISDDIARGLPARADGGAADTLALPALGRAADQAAGTRALLLAGLKAGGAQPRLTAAAQVAHIREQGALGDFNQAASQDARDRFQRTVNGTDVDTAERYLTKLTDQPFLDATDLALSRRRVQAALTARVGLMRGVESAIATAEIQRLGQLRDDDVTDLEIAVGLEGLCLLVAVGTGIWAARTMTQPLAALRIGAKRLAADPGHEEPIGYKGRNDEYAAAVRSVNALHAQVAEAARRGAELEGERKRLVGGRQRLVAEREVLQEQAEALKEEVAELHERLAVLRTGVHGRFVNLSLRTLGLVERQLAVIESLEESESDPERLDTLFKLDHFAARMRRNSENLLVLAGAEQHGSSHSGPVPLLDMLRAAVSEIERYERVRITSLPPHAQVAGFAADDISHLVAELLENATAFSPPEAHVELSGWLLESGELMLSVEDEGIGMTADRLTEVNERLSDAEAASTSESVDEALGLGLYVVVRLAARHGVRVQLRDRKQGGVTAVVVLPGSILPNRPGPAPSAPAAGIGGPSAPTLPGSIAEANSNTLQTRMSRPEPTAPPAVEEPAPAEPAPSAEATAAEATVADAPVADAPVAQEAPEPAPQQPPAGRRGLADDPFVAAAERAIDAAGLGAQPPAEAPAPAGRPAVPAQSQGPAEPPAAQEPPFTGAADAERPAAAPEPSPYGPQSPGPYATAGAAAGTTGEHTRPGETTPSADGAPAVPAPGKGRHPAAAPASADPYAIGPDEHSRPAPAGETDGAPEPGADPDPAPQGEVPPAESPAGPAPRRRTSTGLPKRVPKNVAQKKAPAAPRKTGTAHAEALRRRLGGFQQGARDGRRDVAAEIADSTAEQTIPQTDTDGAGAPGQSHTGEEARD